MVISFGRVSRWLVAIILIIAAQAAYYMDNFSVLIDVVMIDNIFHTDAKEATGIINFGLILSAVLFGIIPAFSEKN